MKLTERETEVLQLLCMGIDRPLNMAKRLGISEFTIRNHIANLERKCGCKTKAQLVAFGFRNKYWPVG